LYDFAVLAYGNFKVVVVVVVVGGRRSGLSAGIWGMTVAMNVSEDVHLSQGHLLSFAFFITAL